MDRVQLRFSQAKFSSQQFSHRRFARIYSRDSPFVRRVLMRFGIPSRDVDDLVHNVFVVLWKRLDEVEGDEEVRPWLYTVAVNLVRNYRRRHRYWRERFVEVMPEVMASGGNVDGNVEWVMDANWRLSRLWRRLGTKMREVFVRVFMEGRTAREVAEELGISVKTVESRVYGVRQLIQKLEMDLGRVNVLIGENGCVME